MYHSGMYHTKKPVQKEPKRRRSIYEKGFRELIAILDREYSFYRRAIAADLSQGIVICVTCGKRMYYKDAELGHYITRAELAVRFDNQNTGIQCTHCNGFRGGMVHMMRAHLVNVYGHEAIEAMEMRAQMGNPWTTELLREEIEKYRLLNNDIRKRLRGI